MPYAFTVEIDSSQIQREAERLNKAQSNTYKRSRAVGLDGARRLLDYVRELTPVYSGFGQAVEPGKLQQAWDVRNIETGVVAWEIFIPDGLTSHTGTAWETPYINILKMLIGGAKAHFYMPRMGYYLWWYNVAEYPNCVFDMAGNALGVPYVSHPGVKPNPFLSNALEMFVGNGGLEYVGRQYMFELMAELNLK